MPARPLISIGLALTAALVVGNGTSARASSLAPPIEPRFVAAEPRTSTRPEARGIVGYCLHPRGAAAVRCRISEGELRCEQGASQRIDCGWRWDEDEEHEPYFRCTCQRS